ASTIFDKTLSLFELLAGLPELSTKQLAETATRIWQAHASMAQIINLTSDLEEVLRASGDPRDRVASLLAEARNKQKVSLNAAIEHAVRLLVGKKHVATVSSSRLVFQALTSAENKPAVTIAESRPMLEGVKQAKALAEAGLKVTIVADAALPASLGEIDLVLVGCDALLPHGLVNKIGTYPLALACRENRIPLVALLTGDKILRKDRAELFKIREHPAKEIMADVPKDVELRNIYFDITPLHLITKAVDENGEFSPTSRFGGA
ncbi:MAG: hypothetical protein ACTSX7_12950, partial [Alphaproteobacteria bacterium]